MKASVNKTCLIGPALAQEQFIAEHLFFYLVKGTMSESITVVKTTFLNQANTVLPVKTG